MGRRDPARFRAIGIHRGIRHAGHCLQLASCLVWTVLLLYLGCHLSRTYSIPTYVESSRPFESRASIRSYVRRRGKLVRINPKYYLYGGNFLCRSFCKFFGRHPHRCPDRLAIPPTILLIHHSQSEPPHPLQPSSPTTLPHLLSLLFF